MTDTDMMKNQRPLNGENTHPLSSYAIQVLTAILLEPLPTSEINPGVVDRLLREDLVEIVELPSPYKKHKGGTCQHLQITDRGKNIVKKGRVI